MLIKPQVLTHGMAFLAHFLQHNQGLPSCEVEGAYVCVLMSEGLLYCRTDPVFYQCFCPSLSSSLSAPNESGRESGN